MNPSLSLLSLAFVAISLLLSAGSVKAGPATAQEHEHEHNPEAHASAPEANWLTGENVSVGGVLFPHIHFISVYGDSTGDQESLAVSHHDPSRDGWTVQGFEFGLSARVTEWLEGFSTLHLSYDHDAESWDHEFEEWFGKVKNLPGGLELRGGKYLNRFGFQNTLHNHGWDFVDQYLVNGRFLGEDGLTTIGGELSWTLPVSWTSFLSVSVGVAPEPHAHDHARGEEEEEHEFEGEGALFDDTFVVANWTNNRDYNDFHQFRFGASGAWGDNRWGETTQIYGAHFEYLWRQNGYESGGRYFRWRTEAMLRSFDGVSGHLPGEEEEEHEEHAEPHEEEGEEHHEEESHGGSFDEFGLYTTLAYGFENGLEFGLRGEFVEGIASAGLDERFRVSPVVTYYVNPQRTLFLRAQYNYDHSSDFGDEHSVFAQVGFNWGGPEVR
jgi:hypothetical protein